MATKPPTRHKIHGTIPIFAPELQNNHDVLGFYTENTRETALTPLGP